MKYEEYNSSYENNGINYNEWYYFMNSCPFYNKTEKENCIECEQDLCLCYGNSSNACKGNVKNDKLSFISYEILIGITVVLVIISSIMLAIENKEENIKIIKSTLNTFECYRNHEEKENLLNKLQQRENEIHEDEVVMTDVQDQIEIYQSMN